LHETDRIGDRAVRERDPGDVHARCDERLEHLRAGRGGAYRRHDPRASPLGALVARVRTDVFQERKRDEARLDC
jgi:hypothetical protein